MRSVVRTYPPRFGSANTIFLLRKAPNNKATNMRGLVLCQLVQVSLGCGKYVNGALTQCCWD